MDSIRFEVTGDRQVGLVFEEFPNELYDALKAEVNALANELFAAVRAATPRRTGRLASEERLRLSSTDTRISGFVVVDGSANDASKAGALEYGAHRSTPVKAHAMRLDHVFGHLLAAPMSVMVEAYNRTPDIQEVAFEHGPLDAMQSEIIERLNAVVERTVAEANK